MPESECEGTERDEWQADARIVAVQARAVRLLVAAQIVGGVGVGVGLSLGALLAEEVASSAAVAGVARTSMTLGAAVFAVPLVVLAARRGRGSSLGIGWVLAAVGAAGLVWSSTRGSLTILILGMLLFGAGSATTLQSRYAATDLALPSRRARTLSMVVWSTTVGAVLGPNLGGPGKTVSAWLSLPPLAGAFVIAAAIMVVAAVATWALLRPDPLLTARAASARVAHLPHATAPRRDTRAVLKLVAASPVARFAFVAIALGHSAMVGVMTMTPVHLNHGGASLEVIGLTLSIHVLGMYAFSPAVGWLSDRWGRIQVIVIGQILFVGSSLAAGLGSSTTWIAIGLFMLGLGWSFTLIAASALLVESVPGQFRTTVQGASDMVMNIAAATAAGVSGPLQSGSGFAGLNFVAATLTIPALLLLVMMQTAGNAGQAGGEI